MTTSRRSASTIRFPAKALWAHVRLTRPLETTFALVGTLIGARLAAAMEDLSVILLLAVSNALLCAASMIFNDWHDLTEDTVNNPHRPVSAGSVPRNRALILALTAFALGTSLAFVSHWRFGFAACLIVVASVAYTLDLKSRPLVGNVLVALITSYPLWCWWLLVPVSLGPFAAVTAAFFLFRIGGELVKTAEDLAGDMAAGVRTVATQRSAGFANRLGFGFMAVGLVLGWGPVYHGQATILYVALLLSSTAVLSAVAALGLVSNRYSSAVRGRFVAVHRSLLFAMAVAVFFGVRIP